MKLRSKTLLFSSLILIILVLVLLSISYIVFQDTYSGIETKYSYHVLNDEITDFNNTIFAMNQTTQDWAQWDDAYSFVSGNNPGFITKDLPPNTFNRLNVNLIIFVNNNGKVIYGKAYDLKTKQYINIPLNLTNFTKDSPLLTHTNLTGLSGVLNLPEGPMIITTQPIVTGHGQGPVKGTLIMGRYINTDELAPLINIPNGTLSVSSYSNTNQSSEISKILQNLTENNPTTVKRLGPDSIAAYTLINDLYGNPAVIFRSEMPRTLYNSYIDTVFYFIVTIILCGVFFVGLILYSLDKNVLARLDNIMGEISDIGKKGDLKRRITVTGNDELSDLASSINNTVLALQMSEKNLEDSEKKYRSIFENTGTAMLIANEDMTISLVNKTFENILKQKKDDIEGKQNWIDMLVPEDRERIRNYHKIHEKGNSLAIPKTYETQANIHGNTKDFFATFDFIPGTRKSLISLIDITDRKRAEGLLTTSLKEKELLLREIHHRVKNSLQLISSLLSLQASEIDDEEIISRYKESENRIHTIALIHESLYQSTNISNINFRNYLEILIEDIINSYSVNTNKIKTILKLRNYNLGIETAIPLGLIINELVSNSLKHAFNGYDKGEIQISLEKNNDTYTLTVKDNGIGLPEGFNFEETSSLGILLINSLVNQLEGNMKVEVNGGTLVIINFTELEYRERM